MTKPKPKVDTVCEWCKEVFRTNLSIKKTCSKKCSDKLYDSKRTRVATLKCKGCSKDFVSSNYRRKYCSDVCKKYVTAEKNEVKEQAVIQMKRMKQISRLSNCLSNLTKKIRSCDNCGKEYLYRSQTSSGTVYCSDECKRKGGNEKKRERGTISKDKRINLNGKADYSINVKKLYERDGGECHICNQQTDFNDYTKTEEGWFIAGNNYPSVDHVIPIAKGGLHRWVNVKLAHRICNSIKGDKS